MRELNHFCVAMSKLLCHLLAETFVRLLIRYQPHSTLYLYDKILQIPYCFALAPDWALALTCHWSMSVIIVIILELLYNYACPPTPTPNFSQAQVPKRQLVKAGSPQLPPLSYGLSKLPQSGCLPPGSNFCVARY